MNADNTDIPGMNISNNYTNKKPIIPEDAKKVQEEMDKKKKEIEKLKSFIIKKYSFTQAIGVLAPQAVKLFIEEELGENVPEKELAKLMKKIHLYVIIPEEQFKNIQKIKAEMIKEVEKLKQDVWIHLKTPVDIWENCLDSKFDLAEAIGLSFPLYDKGILGALRVAEIHKSLVLQKFEKYVVSYILGGSLVKGDAVETSDIDVAIIINDTDVKRMPRLELKERLRAMIHQYVSEAEHLAGVKNKLSPQVWLLTDFWDGVKDAQPVFFTSIRDGVPLYDRGTFMPWKALLKMGKLKPSPEAIDLYMTMGDNTVKRVKRTLLDLVMGDIYWSVITPSQALLMLYGLPSPAPKQIVGEMKRIFVTKEKLLEPKYIKILEEIVVKYYKAYEHGKVKEVSGKEVDKLLKDSEDYMKRLKDLRKQIEKRAQERTMEQIYKDVFELLKSILGRKAKEKLIVDFEKDLVKKGKFTQQHLRILKDLMSARAEFKKGKSNFQKIEEIRKRSTILISDLLEYSQRCDLAVLEKSKIKLKYKDGEKEALAELLVCKDKSFLIRQTSIKKITDKVEDADVKELSEAVEKSKEEKSVEVNPKVFDLLKKELGKFQVVL